MRKGIKNNLTSFEFHLDEQYGKLGSEEREKFKKGLYVFMLGVMQEEKREPKELTQE